MRFRLSRLPFRTSVRDVRRSTRRTMLSLGLVLSLASAPTAFAQGGVVVDPTSPPGKEYALPLEAARGQAAPPDGQVPAGQDQAPESSPATVAPAPAFGAGIAPERPRAQEDQEALDEPGAAGQPSAGARQPAPEDRVAIVSSGTSSATLGSVAVAGGVLLLAAAMAWLARRRRLGAP